jgi:hypothetical protein
LTSKPSGRGPATTKNSVERNIAKILWDRLREAKTGI